MSIKNKQIAYDAAIEQSKVNIEDDPSTDYQYLQLPSIATASLEVAASGNEGGIVYDSTANIVKFSDGANWAAVGAAASMTLDGAFDNGKVVDGADSAANAVQLGDAAVKLKIYGDATDMYVTTSGGDLRIAPAGGDTILTGTLSVSSTLGVTGLATLSGGVAITGAFAAGSNGSGVDFTMFSGAAGDNLAWDASEKTLVSADSNVKLSDGDYLFFGDGAAIAGGDWKMYSDGTHLYFAASDDVLNQAIYLGDDTNDVDVIWEGDTNNAIFQLDASTNQLELNGCDLRIQDNDVLHFGDGAAAAGDYQATCDGTDLLITANANVEGQKVVFGDSTGTNDLDVVWYGLTAGDLVRFDSSDDSVLFTDIDLSIQETGAETALTVSSAATGADGASITDTAALTNGYGALHVYGTGNIADGGAVCILEAKTGVPVAGSRVLELVGVGDDIIGVFADVDAATNHAYSFNCGGVLGANKAVMQIVGDAAVNAGAHALLVDADDSTFCTNNPVVAKIVSASTSSDLLVENSATSAVGAILELKHNPGAEADNDVACRIQFTGSDSAHADEAAGRIDCVMRDETAANPDFDMQFYVDVAGTETLKLELPYDVNGILVGSGAANGVVSSAGNFDLVLQTGNASTGSVSIADGAAGAITLQPDTTGIVYVKNVDTGALGAVLKLGQLAGSSEANDDVVARLQFAGADDAHAEELTGRIDSVIRDVTAANPDADMLFYVDVAGTETLRMELPYDVNGVLVGSGGAAAYVSSAGAQDLVIETNSGTNSGTITITDGADGDIAITPNGNGETLIKSGVVLFAQDGVAANTSVGANHCVLSVTGDGAADVTMTLPEAADNLGKLVVIHFLTDNGHDVIVARTGADTIDYEADLANTSCTFADAGDYGSFIAVSADKWVMLNNNGGTLA